MTFEGQTKGTLVPYGILGEWVLTCDYAFFPDFDPDKFERLSKYSQRLTYYDESQYQYVKNQYSSWLLKRANGCENEPWRNRRRRGY